MSKPRQNNIIITCMKTQEDYSITTSSQTASASGLTRSALSSVTQGGIVKSTMFRVSGSQIGCVHMGNRISECGFFEREGEAARGSGKLSSTWSRVNAQMMTSLPSPFILSSESYPLLIESVQPKLAPDGIPIHFSGSASADQGIDIASVS